MRSLFPGHYTLTTDQLKSLWDNATFVVDTNFLLNLYRYRVDAREDLFRAIDAIKDRLWIPYQVALEFHRNRLEVISSEKKAFETAQKTIDEAITSVKILFDSSARNPHSTSQIQEALSKLSESAEAIKNELTDQRTAQLAIGDEDSILTQIDLLLRDRVGAPPEATEIAAIEKDGIERYSALVPPGFADKKKNTYVDRGITYEAKFGDLIVWRQIIAHAKSSELKNIIFVTDDKKEDWWSIKEGKTLGPHPDLAGEIARDGGVEFFHMYSSDQFLRYAAESGLTNVKPDTIEQIQQVTESHIEFDGGDVEWNLSFKGTPKILGAMQAVKAHVRERLPNYEITEKPDQQLILAEDDLGLITHRIKFLRFARNRPGTTARIAEEAVLHADSSFSLFDVPELYVVAPKASVETINANLSKVNWGENKRSEIHVGYLEDIETDITAPFVETSVIKRN